MQLPRRNLSESEEDSGKGIISQNVYFCGQNMLLCSINLRNGNMAGNIANFAVNYFNERTKIQSSTTKFDIMFLISALI